jgi:SpoVK/Ycf46/Vps4 family AAA+-type ATPase
MARTTAAVFAEANVAPPSADLRRRYLLSCLRDHEIDELDLDRVVRETDGATQAFLKELVHRALQFCVEAGRSRGARATPTTADFSAALAEIRAFDAKATRVITGFRVGLEGTNTQAAKNP